MQLESLFQSPVQCTQAPGMQVFVLPLKPRLSAVVFWAFCATCNPASAGFIDCTVEAGQFGKHVLVQGNTDVYVFEKLDTPSGFRFAAQWLVPSNKLKTYVYFHGSKDRFALIHATEKFLTSQDCQAPATLNRVYSERMEYELSYQCQWVCDATPDVKSKDTP